MVPLGVFKVKGYSMFPAFRDGQYIFASSIPFLFQAPSVGEVVVVYYPKENSLLVKRILKVRGDSYWIGGDNPSVSTDSRKFGWIEKNAIVAKVLVCNTTSQLT